VTGKDATYLAILPVLWLIAPSPLRVGLLRLLLRWILPLVGLFILGTAAPLLIDRWRGPSPREIAEGLRVEAEGLRPLIDACLTTRARIELRFQEHVRVTAELRAAVDSLESLDPRGVPSDSYEEYLALVDRFNIATREWEVRSEELLSYDPRCRELIAAHNALGDSARRILAEEGIGVLERPPAVWSYERDPVAVDTLTADSAP